MSDNSFVKTQVQKVHFIDYIQFPELGPCQPHNSFKIQKIVDMN